MSKVFLLTGLSGAGKTTLAKALNPRLRKPCVILDGDEMRKGACADLGFSPEDREENIRRLGEFAKILSDQGFPVILAVIAPYEKLRKNLKVIIGPDNLKTIHNNCSLDVCMERDPKQNYQKAKAGALKNYTRLGDIYEIPESPDLVINTACESLDESLEKLVHFVNAQQC